MKKNWLIGALLLMLTLLIVQGLITYTRSLKNIEQDLRESYNTETIIKRG